MMAKLFNADTSAFVLNYDQDGNYQDNFTADEVFPVLFDVADAPSSGARSSRRLLEPDFITPVGPPDDLDRRQLVFSVARLRAARRRVAGSHAVVRGRAGAQRLARRSGAFLEAIYATMEGGSGAQHGPGRIRRVVRRRIADQPRDVSLAVDRSEVLVGGRGDGVRSRRLSHERPAASRAAAFRRSGSGPRRCAFTGAAAAHRTSWTCAASDHRRHAAGVGRRALSRASLPGRDVSDEATVSPVEVAAIAFEDDTAACGCSSATRSTARATWRRVSGPDDPRVASKRAPCAKSC